jgi:glutathione S-transferase
MGKNPSLAQAARDLCSASAVNILFPLSIGFNVVAIFSPNPMSKYQLITIPVSHYCEKVRWALDYLGLPYIEKAQMPPFHLRATRKYGGKSVPVLVTDTGSICDSTEILHYLDGESGGQLYPDRAELATELATLFDDRLGKNTRRWGYGISLTRELIYSRWTQEVSAWQKLLFPVIFQPVTSIVKKRENINESSNAESYGEIMAVFDRVQAVLGDGRPYLLGDQFSAIDITFAALAAPILRPPEHHINPRPEVTWPDIIIQQIAAAQESIAGQYGLRMYKEHRRNPISSGMSANL